MIKPKMISLTPAARPTDRHLPRLLVIDNVAKGPRLGYGTDRASAVGQAGLGPSLLWSELSVAL